MHELYLSLQESFHKSHDSPINGPSATELHANKPVELPQIERRACLSCPAKQVRCWKLTKEL